MKRLKINLNNLVAACVVVSTLACLNNNASGQAGVSSMSYGAASAGIHLDPAAFKVEEFINYHRHQLPLPTEERVHLDLRTGELPNGRISLQVGLTTARAIDPELKKPLNLVMVIDRSGSMAGERITKVKQALRMLIERLDKNDSVAIVSYSHSAKVNLSSCHNTDISAIATVIENIRAEGSTNLHAGLMLGYQQAKMHFDKERSNRVILLTDGLANEGVTDFNKIATESRQFNKKGIELSTIGLGHDFNQELLQELADAGNGAAHFVDEAKGMQKIFVDEFDSLLSNAARKLKVEIDFGDEDGVSRVYGYDPKKDGSRYIFKPDNMGHGATQVILAELKQKSAGDKIKVKLTYHDCHLDKKVTKTLSIDADDEQEFSDDPSLRKNLVIAKVAHSLKHSAELCNEQKYEKSRQTLNKSIKFAGEYFEDCDDKDVDRVVKLAEDQQQQIHKVCLTLDMHHKSNSRNSDFR